MRLPGMTPKKATGLIGPILAALVVFAVSQVGLAGASPYEDQQGRASFWSFLWPTSETTPSEVSSTLVVTSTAPSGPFAWLRARFGGNVDAGVAPTQTVTITDTVRPGWGWGDQNHEHIGPPGLMASLAPTSTLTQTQVMSNTVRPGWGWGDKNHTHIGPPGLTGLLTSTLSLTPTVSVTETVTNTGMLRPGWGWGDQNHEHMGPPGLMNKQDDETEVDEEDDSEDDVVSSDLQNKRFLKTQRVKPSKGSQADLPDLDDEDNDTQAPSGAPGKGKGNKNR